MSEDKKIIFSMVGLSKSFNNNNKQVLKDIYLSFFYGAKNWHYWTKWPGKSTLLKIIAGIEKSYQGDIHFKGNHSIGYLEQEPKLDSSKTVMDIVKEGAKDQVELLQEYNKVNELFGLPEYYEDPDKMEELMKRQGDLQDKIDASNAWDLETKLNVNMDALRCPSSNESVEHLSGGERRRALHFVDS